MITDNPNGQTQYLVDGKPVAAQCARCAELVPVTKEDANNYCRILSLLGLEEEGDPIYEIEQLLALREGMTCADCNDTGWLENREEGRYPCTCMTEAEPYQLLQTKITERAAEIERLTAAYDQAGRTIQEQGRKLAKADAVIEAAIGLNFGEDWNKGTHAKIYRPKLRAAIELYQKGE